VLGLALCASALAQSSPMDLVQAEFDSIPRKAVPVCPHSKRVNIFIRLNNSPTSVIDVHAAKTGKFLYPKLVGPWEKELETQLKDAGYCIYFAPIFADVETLEAAPYDQGFHVGGLHLNPLMAIVRQKPRQSLKRNPRMCWSRFHRKYPLAYKKTWPLRSGIGGLDIRQR
jgi:hypothetical protein